MRITILGCGSSIGVPVVGCDCPVCISPNPRNRRGRASILIEYPSSYRVLVDTSPDLRIQCLSNNIADIDAVIFTHAHADHVHGIDDLRPFNMRKNKALPAYGMEKTLNELKQNFSYIWRVHEGGYWTRACLNGHPVEAGSRFRLPSGDEVQTFLQFHGKGESLGLRFGDVVYSTDTNGFPDASLPHLQGMNLWIMDCLRDGEAGGHANYKMAMEWIEQFQPRRTILTHMSHDLDYDVLRRQLPEHILPAYDGMYIDVSDTGNIKIS